MRDFYYTIETTSRPDNVMGLLPPSKLAAIAQFAGLDAASKVIEFGCGFGEALLVWAETFGVAGIGLDAGEDQIRGAIDAASRSPHAGRLQYICTDAPTYEFVAGSFDMAACINATNMFGRQEAMFAIAIRHMKQAIRDDGCLLIAEPYYNRPGVPQQLIDYEGPLNTEENLLRAMHAEGFDLVYMIHSDRADWDRYISSNAYHTIGWLKDNRDHPEYQQRLEGHRRWSEMYVKYRLPYQESVAMLMTRVDSAASGAERTAGAIT